MVDIDKINYKTSLRKEQLKNFQSCISDPDKVARINEQLCVICYYLPKISGQAFSETNCHACNVGMTFANTDVNHYCDRCSEADFICKKCGADLNLRKRANKKKPS